MGAAYIARYKERSAYESAPHRAARRLPEAARPAARPLHRPGLLRARARTPVEEGVALRRPRLRAADAGQLQAGRHRRRAGAARAGRRRRGSRLLQRLPPPGRARRARRVRVGPHARAASTTRGATTSAATSCACPTSATSSGCRQEERGLPPVRCEPWGGWHFVNLDHDAMPCSTGCDRSRRLLEELAAAPIAGDRHQVGDGRAATGRSWPRASSRCTTPARSTARPWPPPSTVVAR